MEHKSEYIYFAPECFAMTSIVKISLAISPNDSHIVSDNIARILCISFIIFFFKFSIPKCYHTQTNIIRQSLTQHLFYIKFYICQGDMFRPSRSSSGPSRTQINPYPANVENRVSS